MRSVFVQRKVLELYQDMDSVSYPILSNLNCSCSASPKAVAFCRIRKWPKSLDALSKTLPFYAKAILERRTTTQIQTVILFSTMLK